jgi:hypothetical protein
MGNSDSTEFCNCGDTEGNYHFHTSGICAHRGMTPEQIQKYGNGNKCLDCGHVHKEITGCCTRYDKKTIEVVNIPIGAKEVEVIEDKIIGYNKVMKDVEEKIPYETTRQVQQTRYNRVAVTKYKTEYYTDYEARTESYYSPYQGMNGYTSYRTNYYPVQKSRQVSYTDYEDRPETYYTTETYTDYTTRTVRKEVNEPIIEKVKVRKMEPIYKQERRETVDDEMCYCRSHTGCKCWRPSLMERLFFGDEDKAYYHECTTYPCKHSSFMARVHARSEELKKSNEKK